MWDPLGLIETRDMRRYEIMEIKHGRAAMLGFLHVIAIEAGVRVPGYLSISQDLKFADVPAGCFASLEAVPTAGWLQIMVLTCMQEAGTGFASKPQTDDAEAGAAAARRAAAGDFAAAAGSVSGRAAHGLAPARAASGALRLRGAGAAPLRAAAAGARW